MDHHAVLAALARLSGDRLIELGLRERAAGRSHELGHEPELSRREGDDLAAPAKDELGGVELEVTNGHRDGAVRWPGAEALLAAVAPEHGAHVGHGLHGVEGLGDVAVRTEVEAEHLVGRLRPSRDHDDGHVAERPGRADEVVTVHPRHHDVHEHDRDPALLEGREAIDPVACGAHLVAAAVEVEGQKLGDVRVVLDHEDDVSGCC